MGKSTTRRQAASRLRTDELLLGFAFAGIVACVLAATVFAVVENYWVGVPFLLVFFNGFAYTALLSTFQASTHSTVKTSRRSPLLGNRLTTNRQRLRHRRSAASSIVSGPITR